MPKAPSTPVGRLSFQHIFTPVDAFDQGKLMFEATLLFDKDKEDLKDMRDRIAKCGKEKFGKLSFKSPIKDGDALNEEREQQGKEPYESFVNQWVVAFRSQNRPGVVDKNMRPINDDGTIFDGCWVRISYSPSAYKVTDAGVNLYLGNIMMIEEGEAFISRSTPEEDFAGLAPEDDDEDFLG